VTDVFISYKRRLRPRVARLAAALEGLGLDVWFDAGLVPGASFGSEIGGRIKVARAVLVCWSPDVFDAENGKPSWVLAEASIGQDRQVLVPVMLEPTQLEPPWNIVHYEDLAGWDPDDPASDRTAWQQVLIAIGNHVGRPGLAEFDRAAAAPGITPLRKWAQKYPNDKLAAVAWDEIERREDALGVHRPPEPVSRPPEPLARSAPPAPPQPVTAPPPASAEREVERPVVRPRLMPMAPPPPPPRSNRVLGQLLQWLVRIQGFASLALVAMILFGGSTALNEQLVRAIAIETQPAFLVPIVLLTLLNAVLFLVWKYRTMANVTERFGPQSVSPAGAVYWYFVPIFFLWKPCQAMLGIDRAYDAGAARSGAIILWWVSWLAYMAVTVAVAVISPQEVRTILDTQLYVWTSVASYAADALTCFAVYPVLKAILNAEERVLA
jgi:hypothetical protein